MSAPMYPTKKLLEALDLLDQLIDPLLALGPKEGVLQGRIQGWKAMMRDQAQQTFSAQQTPLEVPPRPDGLPPYRGG